MLNSARLGFCCLQLRTLTDPPYNNLSFGMSIITVIILLRKLRLRGMQSPSHSHAACRGQCISDWSVDDGLSLCFDNNYTVVPKACLSIAITWWKLPRERQLPNGFFSGVVVCKIEFLSRLTYFRRPSPYTVYSEKAFWLSQIEGNFFPCNTVLWYSYCYNGVFLQSHLPGPLHRM